MIQKYRKWIVTPIALEFIIELFVCIFSGWKVAGTLFVPVFILCIEITVLLFVIYRCINSFMSSYQSERTKFKEEFKLWKRDDKR